MMAAATSGSIRSVLASPQRRRRRRTTSVRAARGNKPPWCHSGPTGRDRGCSPAKPQDWARPACTRCYFYSEWIVFQNSLEKRKKTKKNFDTFCIFSVRAVCGCRVTGWLCGGFPPPEGSGARPFPRTAPRAPPDPPRAQLRLVPRGTEIPVNPRGRSSPFTVTILGT